MLKIKITDLKSQYESIKGEIDAAIQEVINESGFILGRQVNLFEEEIAGYIGVKYAVGVASGTDALVLSLGALDIKENDEVITTPFTFIATAEAISRTGARPVFCDIDRATYNIDPRKIEAKITKRTKAILPVHLYGLPCEMDEIIKLAKKYNLKIIEDCAQAFASEYRGIKAGSIGDCGCFSFFPGKTLGCYGDGGMVATGDANIAKKIRMLRNHGSDTKYFYGMHGFNSRLDTLQAAILRIKLKHIDGWIAKRIENAGYYNELLQGLSPAKLILSQSKGDCPYNYKHSFNYYTLRVKKGRDSIQQRLKDKGIASAVYYPLSLHLQEVYKDLGYRAGDFPIAEEAQNEVLSLPMYPELNREEIQEIVLSIKKFLQ